MIKIRLNKSKSQQINCNPSVFSPTTDLGLLGVAYDDFGPLTVMGQILQEPIINITQLWVVVYHNQTPADAAQWT